jgi:hypothetical protein
MVLACGLLVACLDDPGSADAPLAADAPLVITDGPLTDGPLGGTDGPLGGTDAPVGGDLADAAPDVDAAPPDAAPPGNTVTGTLEGSPIVINDAIAHDVTASGFEFDGQSTVVMMSSFSAACPKQAASAGVPNGRLLLFGLASIDGNGKATPVSRPGTYTVFTGFPAASTLAAEVFYERDGASCLKVTGSQATSGKVNVTGLNPLVATFDLKLDNGDHVSGSFKAPTCLALDANRTPVGGCPH